MDTHLEAIRALVEDQLPEFYAFLQARELTNMLFCYRWILLDFRREFTREEVFQLWETVWSNEMDGWCSLHTLILVVPAR
jgi:hypothetical protein